MACQLIKKKTNPILCDKVLSFHPTLGRMIRSFRGFFKALSSPTRTIWEKKSMERRILIEEESNLILATSSRLLREWILWWPWLRLFEKVTQLFASFWMSRKNTTRTSRCWWGTGSLKSRTVGPRTRSLLSLDSNNRAMTRNGILTIPSLWHVPNGRVTVYEMITCRSTA